jgi:hypothetical protein
LISALPLPLNLDGNSRHPFFRQLKNIRAAAKDRARNLPVINARG